MSRGLRQSSVPHDIMKHASQVHQFHTLAQCGVPIAVFIIFFSGPFEGEVPLTAMEMGLHHYSSSGKNPLYVDAEFNRKAVNAAGATSPYSGAPTVI